MTAPPTVAGRLTGEVAAHRLELDATQNAAAARLDALCGELRRAPPRRSSRLQRMLSWVPGANQPVAPRGLYLWGGVGRGKTLLMDLFCSSLQPSPGAAPLAERSHFYHFMREVHAELATIKQHADPLEVVAARIAERTRVICLDEFFVTDIADAMILAGLFAGLFRRGITLVTTSNLPPRELYKDGLQRQRFLPAIDLIEANVELVHLDGGIDYRLRQLAQAPTYLDSAQGTTGDELRERFASLTTGAMSGPKTLTIEGRTLRARNVGHGTVWFDFVELCEGPRSQNDYIELARLYHTIFISDIPVFEPSADNAARRFIMLIDEFYDRGVKVVASAAAAPTALYHGERLRFEFERTASRLIEMQTEQYLAGEHRP